MNTPYRPDEIAIVRKMFAAGADDAEIGARLGRPHRGVARLRNRLGLRREAKPVNRRVCQHKGVVAAPIYSVERRYRCPLRHGPREDDLLAAFRAGFRGAELQAAAAMRANGVEWRA